MEEKQLYSSSYMVILCGYHESKEIFTYMHAYYEYDSASYSSVFSLSFKVNFFCSIFCRHELVIKYQLRQHSVPQLSVFPSASIPALQPRQLLGQDKKPTSQRMPISGMEDDQLWNGSCSALVWKMLSSGMPIPSMTQFSLGISCFTALPSCSLNQVDSL